MAWKLPFSFSSQKVRCHLCIAHSETADSNKMHYLQFITCTVNTRSTAPCGKENCYNESNIEKPFTVDSLCLDCEATPVQTVYIQSHLQSSLSLLPHRTVTQHSAALTLTGQQCAGPKVPSVLKENTKNTFFWGAYFFPFKLYQIKFVIL